MKQRVLIFYGSYGAGHFSAARSIKEYIDNNYENTETKIVDCIEYINKYYNKVTVKTYDELSRKVPLAWKGVYYGSETWPILKLTSGTNHLFAIKLYFLIKDFNPDLIISTHFFPSEMCAVLKKHRRINCKLATVLTDYAPHKQWLAYHKYIDYFFVAHNDMKLSLEKSGISANKIYATGIPLSSKFLIEYNKDEIINEFGLSSNKTTILFFAGGSSHIARGTATKIFEVFVKSNSFSDIQIITIAGKSIELKQKYDKLVKENNREKTVKVLSFTDKIPQLMHISDLVITKPGGLTTTESLACNVPIIVIDPIPGQEIENAEYLVKNNVAIWLKKKDNIEIVLSDLFSNSNKINEMKNNSKLLAKKNSTKDICEIVMK